jgi:hypothetical protein
MYSNPREEVRSSTSAHRLPGIYRHILEQPTFMQSGPIAKAIAGSSLAANHKVTLFAVVARNKNLEHRRAAFWELKDHSCKGHQFA